MRLSAMCLLAAFTAGCASHERPAVPMAVDKAANEEASRNWERGMAAYNANLTADAEVLSSARAKRAAGKSLTSQETAAISKGDAADAERARQTQIDAQYEAQWQNERLARAQCVYQAQMANVTTPGILTGFLNGLAAGSVCENYYRNIGVIR